MLSWSLCNFQAFLVMYVTIPPARQHELSALAELWLCAFGNEEGSWGGSSTIPRFHSLCSGREPPGWLLQADFGHRRTAKGTRLNLSPSRSTPVELVLNSSAQLQETQLLEALI